MPQFQVQLQFALRQAVRVLSHQHPAAAAAGDLLPVCGQTDLVRYCAALDVLATGEFVLERSQRQPAILEADNLFDDRCSDHPAALLMPDVAIAAFERLRGRQAALEYLK